MITTISQYNDYVLNISRANKLFEDYQISLKNFRDLLF